MKRLRSVAAAVVCVAYIFSGCGAITAYSPEKQYTATFLTLFDTVTTIVGRAESEAAFQEKAQTVYERLEYYHQLFDVYSEYEGINNLKTVNDSAGDHPVKVDTAVIELLCDCINYYEVTGGKVNVAMGSVLHLWHEAREDGLNNPAQAYLPDAAALSEAALHTDIRNIIIDKEESSVYLADPELRLDVGAIAKGWATQRTAEECEPGLLISVGGNVCATGPKDASGTPWVIGIQNPDDEGYLHTVTIKKGSVVTSGDYQRAYAVDGELYHHIIDPDTLQPSAYWHSVSVICLDSGMADALSTALFVMPLQEGKELLKECGAEALWIDREGSLYYSEGFEELIRT